MKWFYWCILLVTLLGCGKETIMEQEERKQIHSIAYFSENGSFNEIYTYDDKVNSFKGIPKEVGYPIFWSHNNIVKWDFIDHSGTINTFCDPCSVEYSYDEDDYPIEIVPEFGKKSSITYKE